MTKYQVTIYFADGSLYISNGYDTIEEAERERNILCKIITDMIERTEITEYFYVDGKKDP